MLKLPEVVVPGMHEFVIVVNEATVSAQATLLSLGTDGLARFDELAAMASDPAVQRELAMIEEEFAVTDSDGLERL